MPTFQVASLAWLAVSKTSIDPSNFDTKMRVWSALNVTEAAPLASSVNSPYALPVLGIRIPPKLFEAATRARYSRNAVLADCPPAQQNANRLFCLRRVTLGNSNATRQL